MFIERTSVGLDVHAATTTADPTAHRRMLALAADQAAGRPLPAGELWEAVKARLGL